MRNYLYFIIQMLFSNKFKTLAILVLTIVSMYLLYNNTSVFLSSYENKQVLLDQGFDNTLFFVPAEVKPSTNTNPLENIEDRLDNQMSLSHSSVTRAVGVSNGESVDFLMLDYITLENINLDIIWGEWFDTDVVYRFIPVVLDSSQREYFDLGDTVEFEITHFPNTNSFLTIEAEIIGFISDKYISFQTLNADFSGSEDIVKNVSDPIAIMPQFSINDSEIYGEFLPITLIWVNGESMDYKSLVNEQLRGIGKVFDVNDLISNQSHKDNVQYQWQGILAIITILITMISLIGYNILLIEKSKKEIVIYQICGMSPNNIAFIFMVQNCIIILAGIISVIILNLLNVKFSLLLWSNSDYIVSVRFFLLSGILYLGISFFVLLYLIFYLKKQNLITMLKESGLW